MCSCIGGFMAADLFRNKIAAIRLGLSLIFCLHSHSHQDAYRNEMENVIAKSSREDEKDDIAVRIMLEMCYAKPTVESAVEKLRNQGNSKYTLMNIMEIITDLLP